jgi:hypothetical protein
MNLLVEWLVPNVLDQGTPDVNPCRQRLAVEVRGEPHVFRPGIFQLD